MLFRPPLTWLSLTYPLARYSHPSALEYRLSLQLLSLNPPKEGV